MKKIFFILLSLIILINVNATEVELAKNSETAILIEATTGKILFEKDKDKKMAPASMTKIMTMLLTMEALESGKISLDEDVLISENAQKMGGTQIYVEAGSNVKVEDLIKGIGIASANDAAVALAEKLGGAVENFIKMMNEKAKELGCKNTNFVNVHGLDDDNHLTTARDMSIMARELLKHEEILNYTSIYEEFLNKPDGTRTWMVNTNKLIKYYNGLDGLKTGFTKKAGYCLTATAKRNGMRLISVVMNEATTEDRSNDTIK